MTEEEIILWSRLKDRGIGGCKFRRQHGIGRFIVDFYCPEKKLAVEVDGGEHYTCDALIRDERRTRYIKRYGIRILRFTNIDVRKNLYGVLNAIDRKLKEI
jgi:type I restriction enzyme M protein